VFPEKSIRRDDDDDDDWKPVLVLNLLARALLVVLLGAEKMALLLFAVKCLVASPIAIEVAIVVPEGGPQSDIVVRVLSDLVTLASSSL